MILLLLLLGCQETEPAECAVDDTATWVETFAEVKCERLTDCGATLGSRYEGMNEEECREAARDQASSDLRAAREQGCSGFVVEGACACIQEQEGYARSANCDGSYGCPLSSLFESPDTGCELSIE